MPEHPAPLLHGDGFILRAWTVEDAGWYVSARDEEIFRWTTENRSLTVAETEAAIREINAWTEALCFAIADSQTGALLGNIALLLDSGPAKSGEMMYWLCAAARGQGIASKAVVRLCEYVFQSIGLERITLKTLRENLSSQRVAERAGFNRIERAGEAPADGAYVWYERLEAS